MTRRRIIVNLIPLLDVLAIMIFGLFLQSQVQARQRRDKVAPEVKKADERVRERDKQIDRLDADLRESARRRDEAEYKLRRHEALAEALEDGLGLSPRQAREAAKSPGSTDGDRDAFLEAARRSAGKPGSVAAVEVRIRNDAGETIVVSRRGGAELGTVVGYASVGDVAARLDALLRPVADEVDFVFFGWDDVRFGTRRLVAEALQIELRRLADVPGARRLHMVRLGYDPGEQGVGSRE